MRIVVYTAVFGGYDLIRAPRVRTAGVDYVCFADSAAQVPPGWTAGELPPDAPMDPAGRNRWAKMHAHRLFPEHDASIYVDGNVEIVGELAGLAAKALEHAPLAMYDHPFRRCLYEEAAACARAGLEWLGPIRRQVERYDLERFPHHAGLYEANVIVRAHHDPAVIRAMTRWWREWSAGIKRDQLSLTYVLWKEKLRVHSLGAHDPRFARKYFSYHMHRDRWRGLGARLSRRYLNRARMLLATGSLSRIGLSRPA
jgi:hypothetical protein